MLNVPSILLMTSRLMPVGVLPVLMALDTFTPARPSVTLFQYLPPASGELVTVLPISKSILFPTVTDTVSRSNADWSSVALNSKKYVPSVRLSTAVMALLGDTILKLAGPAIFVHW